jgi:glyoxylase-like metal-dependent hydrolase (beta-lactamase superfamily II)
MSIEVKRMIVGELSTNCYLLVSSSEAVVIDPGGDAHRILKEIESERLTVNIIVNTHGHYDHILGDDFLREKLKAPLAIHEDDKEMLSDPLKNGSYFLGRELKVKEAEVILHDSEDLELHGERIKIISTPGHTPGSISLYVKGMLFVGDLLFRDSVGRVDLPGGSENSLLESLSKISKLPKETLILPGHGEETFLSRELEKNPFLRKAVAD